MKRMLCLLITLALMLLTAAPALGAETTEVDELLGHLVALLDVREQLRAVQSAMYDAIDLFRDKNDYPSLLAARIVCNEAAHTLPGIALPAMTMSDDTLLALIRRGVETDVVEFELQNLGNYVQAAADNAQTFELLLFTEAYQRSQLATIDDWTAMKRRDMALDAAYDLTMINYLLIPVSGEPAVMAFWESIASRWPVTGSAQQPWESSEEALLLRTSDILEKLETVVDWSASVLGRDVNALDQLRKIIGQEDLQALRADANPIDGMPVMLPLPSDWMLPRQMVMLADDEQPSGMPSTLIMRDEGVDAASFDAYVQALVDFGAELYSAQGGGEETRQVAVAVGDAVLVLHWYPGGEVMLGYFPEELSLELSAYIQCMQDSLIGN